MISLCGITNSRYFRCNVLPLIWCTIIGFIRSFGVGLLFTWCDLSAVDACFIILYYFEYACFHKSSIKLNRQNIGISYFIYLIFIFIYLSIYLFLFFFIFLGGGQEIMTIIFQPSSQSPTKYCYSDYRQTPNIKRTKSRHLNASRLV